MLFTIKKAIEPFLVPPGIFVLILIVSGFCIARRSARAGLFNVLIGLLMWALSTTPVSNELARGLEAGLKPPLNPNGDVIIVLGGGVEGNQPSPDTMARLVAAVKLYRDIHKPVIVSGGAVYAHGIPEARPDSRVLASLGVPPGDIIQEAKSRDTIENAKYSKEICQKSGFKDPIVVTSAIHMKRALESFGYEKMHVSYYPAGTFAHPMTYSWMDYLPQSMRGSEEAVHEYLGLLYLKIMSALKSV